MTKPIELTRYIRHVPNILTISRFFIAPVLLIFANRLFSNFLEYSYLKPLCLFLFFLGCLTDYLDGYLARKLKIESAFGKTFDPIADKVLILGILCILIFHSKLNIYIGLGLVLRDVAMDIIRLWSGFKKTKTPIPANYYAKLKTVFQMVGIFLAMLLLNPPSIQEDILYFKVINLVFVVALVFSWVSFIIYLKKYTSRYGI